MKVMDMKESALTSKTIPAALVRHAVGGPGLLFDEDAQVFDHQGEAAKAGFPEVRYIMRYPGGKFGILDGCSYVTAEATKLN